MFEKQGKEPMRLETGYQRRIMVPMSLKVRTRFAFFVPCSIKEHRIRIQADLITRPGYLWAVGKLPNIG